MKNNLEKRFVRFIETTFTRWENIEKNQLPESGIIGEDNNTTVINILEEEEVSSMDLTISQDGADITN